MTLGLGLLPWANKEVLHLLGQLVDRVELLLHARRGRTISTSEQAGIQGWE